nr:acyltransferase [Curtobacterium flaccumfaciens]
MVFMTRNITSQRRLIEVDAARGVAVIMVVGAHAVLGLLESGALPEDHGLVTAYEITHVPRVAAIAFIAGLFIPGSLARRGALRLIRERAVLFGWLYVVWWTIQSAVGLATDPLRNTPTTLASLAIWTPPAQLYFLPALWVGTVLTVAVLVAPRHFARRSRHGHRAVVGWTAAGLALLAALAIVTWGWVPPVLGAQYLALSFFVAVGAVLGLPGARHVLRLPTPAWAGLGLVTGAVAVWCGTIGIVGPTDRSSLPFDLRVVSLVATCAGVLALCAGAVLLARIPRVGDLLAWIGRRTVVVFTAHIVVVAGTRITLQALGVQPEAVFVAAWVLGVVVPLVLASVAPRIGLGWLFAPPRWATSRVVAN